MKHTCDIRYALNIAHVTYDVNDNWVSAREYMSSKMVNSEGADHPAHPRRLINAIVIRFLELATRENAFF